jgi:hypothetical protein
VPNLCPFHIIASRICYTAKYGALYICSVYIDSFPHTKKLDLEFEICYTFVFLIFGNSRILKTGFNLILFIVKMGKYNKISAFARTNKRHRSIEFQFTFSLRKFKINNSTTS